MEALIKLFPKVYNCRVYEPEEGSENRRLIDRARSIINDSLGVEHTPKYVIVDKSEEVDKLLEESSNHAFADADYVVLFYPVLKDEIKILVKNGDVTKEFETNFPSIKNIYALETIVHETIGSYLTKNRKSKRDTLKHHFISEILEYSTTYLLIKKELTRSPLGKEIEIEGKLYSKDKLLKGLLDKFKPDETKIRFSAFSFFLPLSAYLHASQEAQLPKDLEDEALEFAEAASLELENAPSYLNIAKSVCSLLDELPLEKVKEFFDKGSEATSPEEILEIVNRLI